MKKALFPLVLCTLASPVIAAEVAHHPSRPMPLNAQQMDGITAGAMTLVSNASIQPDGATYVATYADASIKNTPGGVVQIGRASGEVTACCGTSPEAAFSFAGAADGTLIKEHIHLGKPHYQNGTYVSSGRYTIISITPPGLQ